MVTGTQASLFSTFLLLAGAGLPVSADAESGIASIYSGRRTVGSRAHAGGNLTAAHRTLPFGTKVRVTNKRNGNSVVVLVNDRGPFVRGRVIDVTSSAARALGFSGLAPVSLMRVSD
jgi:rare lipoprotein A